jgi:6-pyruvoyltetrahydropterin/6-carboxytetrahydropterin synthase
MYELMIETEFSAAHQLKEARGGCEKLHGHTWKVQVFVKGEKLDHHGILVDFRAMKRIVKKWTVGLDHHYLNEVLSHTNPTTENIAKYLFQKLEKEINLETIKLSKVRVWEARDSSITYSQGDN